MSPGKLARRLFGRHFHLIGEPYRRIFVNMDKVTDCMIEQIPEGAHLLDIGGGDGFVVNMLLTKRPDILATMTDIAAEIGSFITPANRDRVTLMPAADLSKITGLFDVVTMADVIHHVPVTARSDFLSSVADLARRSGAHKIIVKDIQPGNLRALLAYWGDVYITGDGNVSQVKRDNIAFPGFERSVTYMPDFPNYCVAFCPTV